jgi:transcriptional regulator with XRE-family HTH domain
MFGAGVNVILIAVAKKIFAANLVRLRKERGLSQGKLAAMAGVTPSQISFWENENNDKGASFESLDALADALNVSYEELWKTTPDKPLPPPRMERKPTPREVVRAIRENPDLYQVSVSLKK